MLNLPRLETECLSDDTLKSYLAGFLPDDSATQIEQHISHCTECEQLMQQIESQGGCDELLRPIQDVPSDAIMNSQAIEVAPPRLWHPWMNSQEIGPYELIEPLGHGGMGLVYLARHRKLDRLVAIKLLPAHHQTAEARVRFEREILAVGRLQHPAIVSATDAGQFGDMDYLVMEYVRGLDLGRLSKATPVLKLEEVCEIGRQIAVGLSYAHAQGFVHRDIKPSNIILDDNGVVKILDFGLVLFDRWDGVSNELTTVGQFLGTLDYMSPEQAERCGSVDFRADLYALGATMFKLLCGRAPLAAAPNQSPIDKLRLLATHRAPSLKTLRPDSPASLVHLVDNLLSTEPQNRPASAAHVAEDLQSLAKPGCLVDLIARARVADAALKPTSNSAFERSLPSRNVSAPSVPLATAPKLAGGGNRWWPWFAAALLPFAFLAGYIIQLDTPDGQFIVESDVVGAQLKIVKAGAETKSLKIETGNNVTKLSAGKYELTLDSPSDGVTIDRDSFVIERGKVVIARIRKAAASATPESTTPQSIATADSKPAGSTFEGKTLAEWLEVARREKEKKSWRAAMDAVNALTDGDQKKELFEEVFQLCLSQRDLSISNQWGLATPFVNRMVQELENCQGVRRLEITTLAGRSWTENQLDPIWKWLDDKVERESEEVHELVSRMLGLRGSGNQQRLSGSIVYLAKSFPKISALLDDYCVEHWSDQSDPRNGPERDSLFFHVRAIAMKRLESFDKGFAENLAALSIVLERDNNKSGSFLELSADQKELVCRRIIELIRSAWGNRETVYLADWRTTPGFNQLNATTRTSEPSNRKVLCVPRLLSVLHSFFKQVQPDSVTHARILTALAVLEEESRDKATNAIAELSKELTEIKLSDAQFGVYDFRLEDKISYGQKVVYPLSANLSAERRAKIDTECFAYNVHRYVSFLLGELNSAHQSFSPTEIGMRLTAFRMLDLNGDWSLTQDEWLPGFVSRIGTQVQRIRFSDFSKIVSLEELDRMHQSIESFMRLDLNQDKRLSQDEAIGVDDFSSADRNSDGLLTFAEYSMRGVSVQQPSSPPPQATSADARMREWAAGRMKKLDKNGDRFLTPDEFGDDDKFGKADVNKDGKIDVDEYANFRK